MLRTPSVLYVISLLLLNCVSKKVVPSIGSDQSETGPDYVSVSDCIKGHTPQVSPGFTQIQGIWESPNRALLIEGDLLCVQNALNLPPSPSIAMVWRSIYKIAAADQSGNLDLIFLQTMTRSYKKSVLKRHSKEVFCGVSDWQSGVDYITTGCDEFSKWIQPQTKVYTQYEVSGQTLRYGTWDLYNARTPEQRVQIQDRDTTFQKK
jgi:hypothetical protein